MTDIKMTEVKKEAVGEKYFIREENNGITVYNKPTHVFWFYEGLTLSDLEEIRVTDTPEKLEEYLNTQTEKRTLFILAGNFPETAIWTVSIALLRIKSITEIRMISWMLPKPFLAFIRFPSV